jgi:hypothetical protein
MSLMSEAERVAKLPPGHYDIKKFKAAVEAEYGPSWEIEFKYKDRFPYAIRPKTACKLVGRITRFLKVRKVKQLVLNSDIAGNASAVYVRGGGDKGIHFPHDGMVRTLSLLHELSHHVKDEEHLSGTSHGEEFCEMFELVCEAALVVFPGDLTKMGKMVY